MKKNYVCAFAWVILAVGACDKKPTVDTAAETATKNAQEAKSAGPRSSGKEKASSSAIASSPATKGRRTRVVTTKSLGIEGDGDKRSFAFKITNDSSETITWAQTWVYYYDASGKCVSHYPHSIVPKLKAKASVKLKLGSRGKALKPNFVSADVEVSAVDWKGGAEWLNANLAQGENERIKGGPSHAELMQREGEKVTGKWTGTFGKENKPVFQLKNLAGKALTIETLWYYYYDAKGKSLGRDVSNPSLEMSSGATLQYEGGATRDKLKKGLQYIEITISAVKIGNKRWENNNLKRPFRPMKAKAAK